MKNNKKYISIISAVLLVLLLVITVLTSGIQSMGKPYRIIYIPKVNDPYNDFWTSLIEGAQMCAEENGIDLVIRAASAEDDYEGQIACIERSIKDHPDAIILSPSSYTKITEAANKIVSADIKLILIDSTLDENLQVTTVQTDNYEAGKKMGDYIRQKASAKCEIGIVAHVKGASTAMEREEGLKAGLGDNCHVVETVFTDSDYDKAYAVTKDLLMRHPEINVLAGLNEYSAVGAARAVKSMGMSGKILMVGFDSSLEEVKMLEQGTFSAIVIQKPFNMGYLGMENTLKALHGENLPEIIDSGSELITKDTIYSPENEKLLFPFTE